MKNTTQTVRTDDSFPHEYVWLGVPLRLSGACKSVTFGHSGGTDNPVFKHGALYLKCSKNHSSALIKLSTTHVKLSSLKLDLFPQPRRGRALHIAFGIKEVLVAGLWYYCSLASKADTPGTDGGEGSPVFVSVAAVCLI